MSRMVLYGKSSGLPITCSSVLHAGRRHDALAVESVRAASARRLEGFRRQRRVDDAQYAFGIDEQPGKVAVLAGAHAGAPLLALLGDHPRNLALVVDARGRFG